MQKQIFKIKQSKGFTLIELLVVIAIIGLLASVVLVSLNNARLKSRDSKRVADMNQLAKAFELFFNDTSAYPTGTGAIGATTNYVCTVVGCGGRLLGAAPLQAHVNGGLPSRTLTPTYVSNIPSAPIPDDGVCTSAGVDSNQYFYEVDARGSTYTVTFCLGDNTGGLQSGIRRLTPAGVR